MRISTRLYPHPVLSHFSDDLMDSSFETKVNVEVNEDSCIFNVSFKINNDELIDLINQGRAKYAAHFDCTATRFRNLYTLSSTDEKIRIPTDKLDGTVEVTQFVVAVEDIPSYKNNSFHQDYEGMSFLIKKGNVIAVAPGSRVFIEKEKLPEKNLSSVLLIRRNSNPEAPPIELSNEYNKIVIKLSSENIKIYKSLENTKMRSTLISLVVIPALTSVLEMIKQQLRLGEDAVSDLYQNYRWARILVNKLEDMKINFDNTEFDSLYMAQKIVGFPIIDSFKNLVEYMGGEEDDENVS